MSRNNSSLVTQAVGERTCDLRYNLLKAHNCPDPNAHTCPEPRPLSLRSRFGFCRSAAKCWRCTRHCGSRVINVSYFFHVFLNNEKLPFILELSGNNQIYLGIINVIYSVPSSSAVTWYSRSMLLQGRGRSVH